jgi:hypothetical protein
MTSATAIASHTLALRKRPVTAHPAFAALLGIWGAAIGALALMVLPDRLIEAAITATGSDMILSEARLALGGALAAVLGLCCLMLGKLAGGKHRAATKAKMAQDFAPIDPLADLGSASLDAPLGALLNASSDQPADDCDDDTAWLPELREETLTDKALTDDAGYQPASPMASTMPGLETIAAAAPCALDLDEFAALPGRKAVWVEEPATGDTVGEASPPRPAPSALARLRAVPPGELSLCEMVERLAAALQEYQAAQDRDTAGNEPASDREALLNEALGALGRVTERGFAEQEPIGGPASRAQTWDSVPLPQDQRGAA